MNAVIATRALLSCLLAAAAPADAAPGSLDVLPAPGGAPVHLRIATTSDGPDGPHPVDADLVLRRTGPAGAVLQQGTQVTPLDVAPDGTLALKAAGSDAPSPDLDAVLDALNAAHEITGAAGAGDPNGWSATIPLLARAPMQGGGTAPAPLVLPLRAVVAAGGAGEDIDGSAEATIARNEGGRRFGRRGAFGGAGGFGGGARGAGGGPGADGEEGGAPVARPRPQAAPIVLDVHVTGHIAHGALAHLTIARTRHVLIDGLTYSNAQTATIDVVR